MIVKIGAAENWRKKMQKTNKQKKQPNELIFYNRLTYTVPYCHNHQIHTCDSCNFSCPWLEACLAVLGRETFGNQDDMNGWNYLLQNSHSRRHRWNKWARGVERFFYPVRWQRPGMKYTLVTVGIRALDLSAAVQMIKPFPWVFYLYLFVFLTSWAATHSHVMVSTTTESWHHCQLSVWVMQILFTVTSHSGNHATAAAVCFVLLLCYWLRLHIL